MADERHVFPLYIRTAIDAALKYGTALHFQLHPVPIFTMEELLSHFVAESDHAVGYRAYQMNPSALTRRTYWRQGIAMPSGRTVRVTIQIPSEAGKFFWPDKPTKEWPAHDFSPRMEQLYAWCLHRDKVVGEWAIIQGLLQMLDRSANTMAGVKAFWPDIDMLFRMPGYGMIDKDVNDWCKRWAKLGRPRDLHAPIQNLRTYVDQARATILSTQFMDRPEIPDSPFPLQLQDLGDRVVKMPWGDGTMATMPQAVSHTLF